MWKLFKNITLVFLLFGLSSTYAQDRNFDYLPINHIDTSYSHFLAMYSNIDAYSNGLSNKLATQLIKGGYLDDLTKNQIVNSLQDENYLHYRNQINVEYSWKANNSDAYSRFYHISYSHNTSLYSHFSEDLIKLSLFGNQPYIGEELNFGHNFIQNQSYQNISLGMSRLFKTKMGKRVWRIQLGLVMGKNFDRVSIPESVFHTMDNTYETYIRTGFSLIGVEAAGEHLINFPGYGYSLSGDYLEVIDQHTFGFSLKDYGSIYWNDSFLGQIYFIDDTVKSIVPGKINPFVADEWEFITVDSISEYYINSIEDIELARSSYLPGNISIFYQFQWIPEKLAIGAYYSRPISNIRWQEFNVYMKYHFRENNRFQLSLNYDYAGSIHAGIAGEHILGKQAKINWGIHHFEAILSPNSSFGMGAYIGLYYRFKNTSS